MATKENKVWLVSPVTKRDTDGTVKELGYPKAVATSRRKAIVARAAFNTIDGISADSDQNYAITNQPLRGW